MTFLAMIFPSLLYLGADPLPFFELRFTVNQAKWHREQPDRLTILFDARNA